MIATNATSRGNDLASTVVTILGGSPESIAGILSSLPGRTGAAFVVQTPCDSIGRFEAALARQTPMPVVLVGSRRRLHPDRVYVIPRDATPRFQLGVVALTRRHARSGSEAFDSFLTTIAAHCGPSAIAIVLRSDGPEPRALAAVRAHGGITIVEGTDQPLDRIPGVLAWELDRLQHAGGDGRILRVPLDTAEVRRGEQYAAWLASIVQSSQVAIIGKTLEGVITSWNEGAEILYGYSASEMIGAPIFRLVPPDRRDELDDILQRLRRGERVKSLETVRIAKDGRALRVMLSISPVLDADGVVTGASAIAYDITARHEADQALQRSENDLSDFFEHAPLALHWIGPDGIILRVNRAELQMLGYSEDEYVGRHISEFYADPESADLVLSRLQFHETLRDHEVSLRCKDGSIRIGLVSSNVRWEDGRFLHTRCFTRDVTEQKRAQRELAESEQRLSLALEAGRMGTWEWDVRTNRVQWSKSLEAIHGLAPGTFGGKFEDFRRDIYPEDEARVLEAIQSAIDRLGEYQVQYRICLPTGPIAWLEARGRVLGGSDGRPARVIGLCMDVTQRKHAEAALAESARRKDEFLAMLGHELRNPLAPILNVMHLLRLPNANPEQTERAWQMMERQVTHLSRLVDDLLDVSRISSGKILLRKEHIDLGELVRQALEDHRGLLDAHGLTVRTRIASSPVIVDGDATRLTQVLGNLLHNASKFTERGGTVTVSVRSHHGTARVSVSDNGTGIAPELLSRVFEPFSQANPGIDRARGGLGLGLALVKALMELHGGSVEARSGGVGQGSEFILCLPLALEPERRADAAAPVEPEEALRILVVEDNPDAAASMRMMLELEGHSVEIAADGPTSLEIARTFAPDVVLCDIGLPGSWDGYAVARAFRSDPELRSISLVALTGYGQTTDRERSLAAGFDTHLTKPVPYGTLRQLFASVRAPGTALPS